MLTGIFHRSPKQRHSTTLRVDFENLRVPSLSYGSGACGQYLFVRVDGGRPKSQNHA